MDAIICDGKTLKTGAVACVKDVKNCITLARAVMDKTGHCLLVGEGAEAFARQQGIPAVPMESLVCHL
jgi:beta-aspartyl-peptidase (threonine type)